MDIPLNKPAAAGGKVRMWCKRVGWLVLIWLLSVAALGVAAGLMKLFMHALGMR
jgi:hypothetical protein